MVNFCKSDNKCLRKQLVDHFGTKRKLAKDEKHNCCVVCRKSCKCYMCLSYSNSGLTRVSIGGNQINIPDEATAKVPVRIAAEGDRRKITDELHALRLRIGSRRRHRFVGISLSTGLSETLIDEIANNVDFITDVNSLEESFPHYIFIISQLRLTSHPRSTVVLLDTGTPGTSREIYSEDADGETRTRNPWITNPVL